MDHWLKGLVQLYRINDDITTQNIDVFGLKSVHL